LGKIWVCGVGHPLRSDDGLGLAAVAEFSRRAPPGVNVLAARSPLDIAAQLEDAGALVIFDAVQAGGRPGTLYVLDGWELDSGPERPGSLHEWGLGELGALARARRVPVTILGLEPACTDPGTQLTPPVQSGLARLVDTALALAEGLKEVAGA